MTLVTQEVVVGQGVGDIVGRLARHMLGNVLTRFLHLQNWMMSIDDEVDTSSATIIVRCLGSMIYEASE